MIRELDNVVLTVDLPEHGLKKGDVGTVVLVHDSSHKATDHWVCLKKSNLLAGFDFSRKGER